MSTEEKIKDKLLEAGVKNLYEFGYPSVTKENILTDMVYSAYFKNMLTDNIGKSNNTVDKIIEGLIQQINQNEPQ